MSRKAINASELPVKAAAIKAIAKKRRAQGTVDSTKGRLKSKDFESLNAQEKDELLKAVALELGFLQPS
jgi:hypothetical protein